MHSKIDNKEIKVDDNKDKIIGKFFKLLLDKYKKKLETSMSGSDFIFDCVYVLFCKCHKISSNRGAPYINSLVWIESKKQH